MDEDIQADHVYTDLSKSFDKIDYNILIQQLSKIHKHGNLLQ